MKLDVCAPMAEAGHTREDVMDFWNGHPLDLKLPLDSNIFGNCVGCFLKGYSKLEAIAEKEQLRRELMPRTVVTNEQLAALGSRLEALHTAQLISDEILFVCPLLKHPLRLHPCGALWCIVVQLGLISV